MRDIDLFYRSLREKQLAVSNTSPIDSLDEALGSTIPAPDLPRSLQPERWAELARSQDRSLGLDLGMKSRRGRTRKSGVSLYGT